MLSDWVACFGEARLKQLSLSHITRFAGKNPLIRAHRIRVGHFLGITEDAVAKLTEASDAEINLLHEATMTAEEEETLAKADQGAVGYKRFKPAMTGFTDVSHFERATILRKWRALGRVLVTFPLISHREKQYNNLNTLLGHVKQTWVYFLILRLRFGGKTWRLKKPRKIKGVARRVEWMSSPNWNGLSRVRTMWLRLSHSVSISSLTIRRTPKWSTSNLGKTICKNIS